MFDCREVLLHGTSLRQAARLLWERLKPYQPEMIGGMTMAANPLTIALIYEAHQDGFDLDGFLIRRESKADGLKKLIEGPPIKPGTRVALIDDLVNSGATQQKALEVLDAVEAAVVAVGVVLDYQSAGTEWIRSRSIPLEALFKLTDLGMKAISPGSPKLIDTPKSWVYNRINNGRYDAPKSSPLIDHDAIYVGSDDGYLIALSRGGKEIWRHTARPSDQGVHSSPRSHAGRIYYGAYDGFVYSLEAKTGAIQWERRIGQWVGSSPAIDCANNCLYIGGEFGESNGSLYCIDLEAGHPKWNIKMAGYVHSSPWSDNERSQVLVGANDGALYAIDNFSGAIKWKFVCGGEIKSQPVIDDAGRCFCTSFDGYLYALDAAGGKLLWRRKLGHRIYFTPFVYQDIVVTGSNSSRLIALDRQTGVIRWVCTTGGIIAGGAALWDSRYLAIGSADGCIYLIHPKDGRVMWQYLTGGPIRTTPGVYRNTITVPSCDGGLYSFTLKRQGL